MKELLKGILKLILLISNIIILLIMLYGMCTLSLAFTLANYMNETVVRTPFVKLIQNEDGTITRLYTILNNQLIIPEFEHHQLYFDPLASEDNVSILYSYYKNGMLKLNKTKLVNMKNYIVDCVIPQNVLDRTYMKNNDDIKYSLTDLLNTKSIIADLAITNSQLHSKISSTDSKVTNTAEACPVAYDRLKNLFKTDAEARNYFVIVLSDLSPKLMSEIFNQKHKYN